MKQNKNTLPTSILSDYQPDDIISFEYVPLGKETAFRINGITAAQARNIEATVQAEYDQADKVATQTPKPRQTASTELERPIYTEPSVRDRLKQYIADSHVRRFDKIHGSNLYGELLEQRRKDALFLKASQIGLLGQDSLFYKRKLGQLAKD